MTVEYCDLAVCTGKKSLTALDGSRALFHTKCAEALKGCQPWILLVSIFRFYWYLRLSLQIVNNLSKLRREKIYITFSSTTTPHIHTVMRKIRCKARIVPFCSGLNVLFVSSLQVWNILRCLAHSKIV